MRKHIKLCLVWWCCITVIAIGQMDRVTSSSEHANPVLQDLLDPSSSIVFIAAHRGGYENDKTDKAPENSVVNIANSQRKGYELFETDIQRTKDGHFVMAHDPTINRETSGVGKVSDMTLIELKALHKRYRDLSLSPERIATLEEFLKQGKGRTVFKADMKPGVSKHFVDIMKLVTDHNALEGIIFRVPYRDAEFYDIYRKQGGVIAKHTLMFQVTSKKQVDDIKTRFDSSTIEIKLNKAVPTNEQSLDLIRYATDTGFIVETHAEGGEEDWIKLIDAGVRIFHTKTPSKLKALLQASTNH